MKRRIGVDLHKRSFTVCYMEEDGKYTIKVFKVSAKGFEGFIKTLRKEDEVAVESTGNTAYFVGEIEGIVEEIKIVNPTQFKVIANSAKKTDKLDAVTIATYLKKGLIPEVRMRSKEESQIASLIGTRDKLVKLRTTLKNKIHNILNANGIVTKAEMLSSEKGLNRVLEIGLDTSYLFELRIIVEQIRSLNKAIKEIDKELSSRGKELTGHKNLTSITGIGDISATILLSVIGNIDDFANEKKLAAYLGIVPRVHITGESKHYGRITKMGNKIARTTLVQSTLIAIRYNAYLRRFYVKLKVKKGSGKAIIATARKLLAIIYRTLKNDWVFEDFNRFQLVEN